MEDSIKIRATIIGGYILTLLIIAIYINPLYRAGYNAGQEAEAQTWPTECIKNCPDCTCPLCPTCPTSTTATTIPCKCTCPTCSKTACPELEDELTEDMKHKIKNYNGLMGTSAQCQRCGHETKYGIMKILNIETPRFNEGPSLGTGNFYRPNYTSDEYFMFRKQECPGGRQCFLLNRTPDGQGRLRWGWNDGNCKGHILEVYELG